MFRFLGLILLLFAASAAHADDRPNIVFILVDDMGFSDLGCFGGEIDTPNLDKLGEGGIRFTRFYNTSKCFPSRACLLTGTYAQLNGNHSRFDNLENSVTLGEALRSSGYRTIAVGKHHGSENLYDRGFDHYYGLRDGAANHFNPGYQRPGEPNPAKKRLRAFCFDSRTEFPYTPGDENYYSTDSYTNWSIDLLDKYRDEEKPFFLYLSYQAPHDPLQAWQQDIDKYRGKYDIGYEAIARTRYEKQVSLGLIDPKKAPRSEPTYRSWGSLTPERRANQAKRMEIYAAMIDRLDRNVGKLVAYLEERGDLENTLIMFASDNGGSAEIVNIPGEGEIGTIGQWTSLGEDWANVSNTPFRLYKNYSYEGGIRTPLIAYWPKGIAKGGRFSDFHGHFIDVMPTVLTLANGEYPDLYDGKKIVPRSGISFASVFRGGNPNRSEPLFWSWRKGMAISDGKWKLVSHNQNWELFDIENDWTERIDLSLEMPEVVENLKSIHSSWLAECQRVYEEYRVANLARDSK